MKFDFNKCNNAKLMYALTEATSETTDLYKLYKTLGTPDSKNYKENFIYEDKYFQPLFDFMGQRNLVATLEEKIDEKQKEIDDFEAERLKMVFGSVTKYADDLKNLHNDRSLLSQHSKTEEYKKLQHKIDYQKKLLKTLKQQLETAKEDTKDYVGLEKLFFQSLIRFYTQPINYKHVSVLPYTEVVNVLDNDNKLYFQQNCKDDCFYTVYNDENQQHRMYVNYLKDMLTKELLELNNLHKNKKAEEKIAE